MFKNSRNHEKVKKCRKRNWQNVMKVEKWWKSPKILKNVEKLKILKMSKNMEKFRNMLFINNVQTQGLQTIFINISYQILESR